MQNGVICNNSFLAGSGRASRVGEAGELAGAEREKRKRFSENRLMKQVEIGKHIPVLTLL